MAELDVDAGPVAERVAALAAPICADLGVELYDVEHAGGTVRVTVSRPDGLDLEAISLITRLLSRDLDHTDPVPGHYTLEVSSPGLERTLRRVRHYQGAIGERVSVRLNHAVDGTRRIHGTLVEADDDGITVRPDDQPEPRRIAYADIERTRTVFEWGPTPKPGKGSRPGGGAKRAGGPERTTKETDAS